MPSSDERKRRRAISRNLRDREYARAEARMPIGKTELRTLLDYLDKAVFEVDPNGSGYSVCDHSLRKTEAFLSGLGVWSDAVRAWLAEYGGYCDCEVALNVGSYWGDRLWPPQGRSR